MDMLKRCVNSFIFFAVAFSPFFSFITSNSTFAKQIPAKEVRVPEEIPGYIVPYKEPSLADRFIFIGNVSAYFSLSDMQGAGTIGGGGFSAILAPGYRITDQDTVTLLYDGSYYRRRDFYSDEVGPRQRLENQRHTLTAMYRHDFGSENRYSISPSIFYTESWNKDVEGGGWSDGLYNYRDKGAGIDFGIKGLGFGSKDKSTLMKIGIQVYDREYPNYTSLLDLATGLGIEKDERDYLGILFRARFTCNDTKNVSWSIDYYLLAKRLEDKRVVDSNGYLSSKKQRDYLHNLTLHFSFRPWNTGGFRLNLDLMGSVYDSNQNYYDGMGTLDLSDDEFIKDFYDYRSFRIEPGLSYTLPSIPITLSLSYAYQRLNYREREAQKFDGSYKSDKQYEIQNELNIGLHYYMLKKISIYARYQYISVHSNNDYTRVYEYDHTVNNYYAGISYSF